MEKCEHGYPLPLANPEHWKCPECMRARIAALEASVQEEQSLRAYRVEDLKHKLGLAHEVVNLRSKTVEKLEAEVKRLNDLFQKKYVSGCQCSDPDCV